MSSLERGTRFETLKRKRRLVSNRWLFDGGRRATFFCAFRLFHSDCECRHNASAQEPKQANRNVLRARNGQGLFTVAVRCAHLERHDPVRYPAIAPMGATTASPDRRLRIHRTWMGEAFARTGHVRRHPAHDRSSRIASACLGAGCLSVDAWSAKHEASGIEERDEIVVANENDGGARSASRRGARERAAPRLAFVMATIAAISLRHVRAIH